jgi:hypothetical protein
MDRLVLQAKVVQFYISALATGRGFLQKKDSTNTDLFRE